MGIYQNGILTGHWANIILKPYNSKKIVFKKYNYHQTTLWISLRFAANTVCLSQLSQSWGTGSEKNLITQLMVLLQTETISIFHQAKP